MSQTPENEDLVTLTSVPSEIEAAPIVAELQAQGIPAHTVGGFTAGFRAEAPGEVQILVTEEHAEQARGVLDSVRRQLNDIDWSQVDVGEPEEADDA